MNTSDINRMFRRAYNGQRNVMTPNLSRNGKRGRLLYEISYGKGIDGDQIWGVTVIETDLTKRHDLSRCFHSYEAADAYVSSDFMATEAVISELS